METNAEPPSPIEYPAWFDEAAGIQRQHEPVSLAIDAFVGSLTAAEFDALVSRTRGGR